MLQFNNHIDWIAVKAPSTMLLGEAEGALSTSGVLVGDGIPLLKGTGGRDICQEHSRIRCYIEHIIPSWCGGRDHGGQSLLSMMGIDILGE